jgi:hypothetical protein
MAPSITPCEYTKQAREGGERSGYEMVKKWLRSGILWLVLSLISMGGKRRSLRCPKRVELTFGG